MTSYAAFTMVVVYLFHDVLIGCLKNRFCDFESSAEFLKKQKENIVLSQSVEISANSVLRVSGASNNSNSNNKNLTQTTDADQPSSCSSSTPVSTVNSSINLLGAGNSNVENSGGLGVAASGSNVVASNLNASSRLERFFKRKPFLRKSLRMLDIFFFLPMMYLGTNATLFFVFADSGNVGCYLASSIFTNQKQDLNAATTNIVYFWKNTVLMNWFGLSCPAWNDIVELNPKIPNPEPMVICDVNPGHDGQGCSMIIVYVLVELLMWVVICKVLYHKKWFWRL